MSYASELYTSFFMRNDRVCYALGTDKDFLHWTALQPSVLDGDDYNILACHVRRAGEAGMAWKPRYCAVPMTNEQHQLQHSQGELACIKKYYKAHRDAQEFANVADAKRLFDKWSMEYREEWAHQKLRTALQLDMLSMVTREIILPWAVKHSVDDILP